MATEQVYTQQPLTAELLYIPAWDESLAVLLDAKGKAIGFEPDCIYSPVGGLSAAWDAAASGIVEGSIYYQFNCAYIRGRLTLTT